MTPPDQPTVAVLDVPRAPATTLDLVRGRSLRVWLAHRAGRRTAEIDDEVGWPILLVRASATTKPLRARPRTFRSLGAVDLRTGRCGMVDVDLPRTTTDGSSVRVLPARVPEADALAKWHEFHRDHTLRHRRTFGTPQLTVDGTERVHVPHDIVVEHHGSTTTTWLVDRLAAGLVPTPTDLTTATIEDVRSDR